MRAWRATSFDGPGGLSLTDLPRPTPESGEVLVEMRCAGVSTLDWLVLTGALPPTYPKVAAPLVMGNQGMGVIVEAGDTRWKPGQRVMFTHFAYGVTRPGCWADYVTVKAAHLGLVPDHVSDEAAANMPNAYPTAFLALEAAGFTPGKSVLATGVGGSVGNAACQLAQALGASAVISTAGSTAKADQARAAGLDKVVDLSRESLAQGVRRLNGGKPVDLAIETIGGPLVGQALGCVGFGGVVITLGLTAGEQATVGLSGMIGLSARLQGFGVYHQPQSEWARAYAVTGELISAGEVRPLIERVFPFGDAPEAVRHLALDRPFGTVAIAFA